MPITVTLTEDEGLVLFDLLSSNSLPIKAESAEWHALNSIEGDLERQLVSPFSQTYAEDLEKAKKNILAKFCNGIKT